MRYSSEIGINKIHTKHTEIILVNGIPQSHEDIANQESSIKRFAQQVRNLLKIGSTNQDK